jgi:hypothetical protein
MKEGIPTGKLVLSDGTEVEYYKWLTQDEEDQYLKLTLGDNKIDTTDEQMTVMLGAEQLVESRKFLVESLLKNMEYSVFSALAPQDRKVIQEALGEVREQMGKE